MNNRVGVNRQKPVDQKRDSFKGSKEIQRASGKELFNKIMKKTYRGEKEKTE